MKAAEIIEEYVHMAMKGNPSVSLNQIAFGLSNSHPAAAVAVCHSLTVIST